ncbi:Imm43 family immunity protein [Aeromonas hydrophila]|uniref:Imm43 family immunity protein n=1 Tax=Aeromonas hydrophila TaxID=644 RepID=UPI003530B0BA
MLDTTYLRTFIVINDKVKNALEMSALKGFKIIPLQNGFSEYCNVYGRTIEELLPKIKRRMP